MTKVATKPKAKKVAEPQQTVSSIKGFDHDMKCRGFQFEVGKSYTVFGEIKACENGFHACENPFDVWSYYPVVDFAGRLSRYAEVEQSGAISRRDEDSKIASGSITVKAEIFLPEFVKRAVKALIDLTKGEDESGNYAQIGSNGYSARIGSSGDSAQIGSSGDSAQIGSSGDYARIGSSGNYAQIGSNGYSARIGSSGNYAQIGSNGYSAQIGSSGDYARIGSSGNYAQIGSSGDYARIGSSGNYAQIVAEGSDAVIACAGAGATVSGVNGSWLSLAEYVDGKCIGFATGCIGQGGLLANTPYKASGGKLVAA